MISDEFRTRAASLLKRWEESSESCAEDLRALSTESASWEEMDREQIAAHAARALVDTLELEFAVVQLKDASAVGIFGSSASHDKPSELSAALLQALQDLDREAYPRPIGGIFDWQSPSGGPAIRMVRIPIGLRDDGWVFASSIKEGFPKDSAFVTLTACANQIAVALQAWRGRLARRDEGEHLQQFSQNSPDALWIVKISTMQIEYISPAFSRIWGKKTTSLLGNINNWLDSIFEADRSSAIYALNAVIGGEIVAQNYNIIVSPISSRRIRHVLFPIRDDQGRVTHVGGAAEDVTTTADIQVYVLSNDVTSRESIGLLLRTNGFAVKLFASSRVFLEAATVLVPGCLILERRGTEAMVLRVVTELKARGIDMPIIVIDKSRGGVGVAVGAMKAGATDWLEAPYAEAELVAAVASALAGVQIRRDAGHATKLARSRLAKMTPREREVLLGLVAGETNKEIARRLGISPRTVESHRAHVMERLGAKTLSEAVLLAASTGHF